jgi:hypothetical protein
MILDSLPERLLNGSQENQNTQFTNYIPNSLQIPILTKVNLQLKVLVQGKKFFVFLAGKYLAFFFFSFLFFCQIGKTEVLF